MLLLKNLLLLWRQQGIKSLQGSDMLGHDDLSRFGELKHFLGTFGRLEFGPILCLTAALRWPGLFGFHQLVPCGFLFRRQLQRLVQLLVMLLHHFRMMLMVSTVIAAALAAHIATTRIGHDRPGSKRA